MKVGVASYNPFKKVCGLEIIEFQGQVSVKGVIVHKSKNSLNISKKFDQILSDPIPKNIPICLSISGESIIWGDQEYKNQIISQLKHGEFLINKCVIHQSEQYFFGRVSMLKTLIESLGIQLNNIIDIQLGPSSALSLKRHKFENDHRICFGGHSFNLINQAYSYSFNPFSKNSSLLIGDIDSDYFVAFTSTFNSLLFGRKSISKPLSIIQGNRESWFYKLINKNRIKPFLVLSIILFILQYPINYGIERIFSSKRVMSASLKQRNITLDSIASQISDYENQQIRYDNVQNLDLAQILDILGRSRIRGISFSEIQVLNVSTGQIKTGPKLELKGKAVIPEQVYEYKSIIDQLIWCKTSEILSIHRDFDDTYSFQMIIDIND